MSGPAIIAADDRTNALPTKPLWTAWQLGTSIARVPQPEDGARAASIAFGARMRKLREARGISQDGLADAADIHPTAIGRLERGSREPRLTTILRISQGLEVAPGELLDDLV